MTVLLAIGVIPMDDTNPFLIMGSDTKKVTATSEMTVLNTENKFEKVHEINDKLIGVSGAFDDKFLDDLLIFIKNNDLSVKYLTEECFLYVKNHIVNSPHKGLKVAVFIGAVVNEIPCLGFIDVKKDNLESANYKYESVVDCVLYSSNFGDQDRDVMDEFSLMLSESLDFKSVRKSVTNCLKKAASRRTDFCNKDIRIKVLGNN